MHAFIAFACTSVPIGSKSQRQRDHSIQNGWFPLLNWIGNLDFGARVPTPIRTEAALGFGKCLPKFLLISGRSASDGKILQSRDKAVDGAPAVQSDLQANYHREVGSAFAIA
jgi:hypothetical protein